MFFIFLSQYITVWNYDKLGTSFRTFVTSAEVSHFLKYFWPIKNSHFWEIEQLDF
jgi:hypothetical protein